MILNTQIDTYISYINEYFHRLPSLDRLLPFIFYQNKDVQNHNTKMLSHAHGQEITLKAIDEHEIYQSNYFSFEKTI